MRTQETGSWMMGKTRERMVGAGAAIDCRDARFDAARAKHTNKSKPTPNPRRPPPSPILHVAIGRSSLRCLSRTGDSQNSRPVLSIANGFPPEAIHAEAVLARSRPCLSQRPMVDFKTRGPMIMTTILTMIMEWREFRPSSTSRPPVRGGQAADRWRVESQRVAGMELRSKQSPLPSSGASVSHYCKCQRPIWHTFWWLLARIHGGRKGTLEYFDTFRAIFSHLTSPPLPRPLLGDGRFDNRGCTESAL